MSPAATFDRIYRVLKERLMAGVYPPGEQLESAALGSDLHASVTPVRDALHRLAGERMVEAPNHDGFKVPAPSEAELRDLFGWSAFLLDLALRRKAHPAIEGPAAPSAANSTGSRDGAWALFGEIAEATGSGEHPRCLAAVGERLAPYRAIESSVFADVEEEAAELRLIFASGNRKALRRAIAAYHRRRQRAAPDLIVELRRFSQRGRSDRTVIA